MWFVQYEKHHMIIADSSVWFVCSSFSALHPPDVRFRTALAVVVRMFRVDYGKVNQGQSSDPLALFRPSKAYSSLFSQYSLTSISAVSPDKPLCMCVWVCVACFAHLKVIRCKDFPHANDIHVFGHMNSAHTHLRAMSLISHLLSKGIFWGSTGQWIPVYSCL